MDLQKVLEDLHAQVQMIEQAIACLESLLPDSGSGPEPVIAPKRRGRKSMDPVERQEVSRRMKKYWASRRKARDKMA